MRGLRGVLRALAWVMAAGFAMGARAQDEPVELRVMTFNIWYGGGQVGFGEVVEAISAADADIVGLQEMDGRTRELADRLGWHADEARHVVSRYPLFHPPGGEGLHDLVEIRPGRFVAVANVHLPATPYGPEEIRDGGTPDEVMALERETRLSAVEPYVEALAKLMVEGVPVFLTGDFNSPSHLDWTEATLALRPERRYAFEWPVSKALADAGLRDSWREMHPDPAERPGFTWTPGYPWPRVKPEETHDRIDLVWAGGASTTIESQLVGEPANPDVDIEIGPWPSDHRAVVATFRVLPAPRPPMVAVERRVVAQGDPYTLRFHLGDLEEARIAVVPRGGDAAQAVASIATGDGSDRPSIAFGSALMRPGAYEALLLDAAGKELARASFWLLAKDAAPEIAPEKASFVSRAPIAFAWRNAPGNRFDWVALYDAGEPDLYNYYAYLYTGAAVEGSAVFDESVIGGTLPPGDYELRLLRDDSYVLLATAPFTVTAP